MPSNKDDVKVIKEVTEKVLPAETIIIKDEFDYSKFDILISMMIENQVAISANSDKIVSIINKIESLNGIASNAILLNEILNKVSDTSNDGLYSDSLQSIITLAQDTNNKINDINVSEDVSILKDELTAINDRSYEAISDIKNLLDNNDSVTMATAIKTIVETIEANLETISTTIDNIDETTTSISEEL